MNWLLRFKNMTLILIASITIGTLAMFAVYALPTDRMMKHIETSADFFKLGDVPRWSKDVVHTSLDNFADAIILLKAVYPVKDIVQDSMLNPSWLPIWDGNLSPAKGMVQIAENGKLDVDTPENIYPRYWHGYMTIVKPMLMIFKAEQLRVLNLYVQFLLIVTALILIYKRLGIYYMYSFALMILFFNPITTALAFQHTNVFCTMLLTVIAILKFNDKLKVGNRYTYFFLLIGICTAYFDLLTCPMTPLGIGLVFYFALNRSTVIEIFDKCIAWSYGYVGMWSSKIILATLLTNHNVIMDALGELAIRTSHHDGHGVDGESISILSTWYVNLRSFTEGPARPLLILLLIFICYSLIKFKNQLLIDKTNFKSLGFIIAMPFMWYAASCNHSYVHNHFAYRELTVAFIGFLALIIETLPQKSLDKKS